VRRSVDWRSDNRGASVDQSQQQQQQNLSRRLRDAQRAAAKSCSASVIGRGAFLRASSIARFAFSVDSMFFSRVSMPRSTSGTGRPRFGRPVSDRHPRGG